MAIDDNASYELTGYQVKDLAGKVRAKADSSSLASVATSGLYSDLVGAPTIPTVYNGTLTIQQNGTTLGTFSANQSTNETINITGGGGGGGGTAFYLNNSLTTLPSGYVAPTLYKDQALTTTATFQELWDAYKSGGAVLYFANSWKAEIYTIAYAWDDLNEGHDYHFALYTYNHGNNQSTQSGAIANSVVYHLDGGASDTTSYTLVGEYFTVIPPEPKVFWTNVDADLFDDTTTVYFYKDSQLQTTAMLSDIAWHAGVVDTYIFVKHNNIPAKKFKVIYSNPYYDSDNKYSFEVVGDLDPSSSTQPLIAKFRGAGSATSAAPIVAKLAPMAGATSSVAGSAGLVPAPAVGDQDKFLKGDGTWGVSGSVFYEDYSGGVATFYFDQAKTQVATGQDIADAMVAGPTYYSYGSDDLASMVFCVPMQGQTGQYIFRATTGTIVMEFTPTSTTTYLRDTINVQEELTAGANISISSGTISATDTTYSNFTGATSSVAGAAGLVPAPAAGDEAKALHGDGTWKDTTAKLVEMSYGEANAWTKFINAYNAGSIVYCRASSNANPASGSQTRKAFMAYVNNAANPTSVEFQYVRSVSSKTEAQPVDQVFVYTLTNSNGGTWSVASRNMGPKIAAGTGINVSYSNGTYTISLAS